MAKIPTSTQTSLCSGSPATRSSGGPKSAVIETRYRAGFAYIDAVLANGEALKLCWLRYGGSAHQ